jgi:hypothetical protein
MTNEIITIIHRPPIYPENIVLWCSWLLAVGTTLVSLMLVVLRRIKGRSLAGLASTNLLIALISGVGCASSLLWGTGRMLAIHATFPEGAVASAMRAASWQQTFMLGAVSTIVVGISTTIGLALTLKWKEPQPANPSYRR